MKFDDLVEEIESTLGPWAWRGAYSRVWFMGPYVIKATTVSIDVYRINRILMRREGPFAKIREMQVVGKEYIDGSDRIVCYMVQDYIRPNQSTEMLLGDSLFKDRNLDRRAGPRSSWESIKNFDNEWFDGMDRWACYDVHESNIVAGLIVDMDFLELIKPTRKNGHPPIPI